MTFEEAMESLGAELGVPLPVVGGRAGFEVSFADGEGDEAIGIDFSEFTEGETAVVSADLGELPEDGAEALMMEMLEANHLFFGTGGAAFSVDGGRVRLERHVQLLELGRGEGSNVVLPFIGTARHWAGVVAGRASSPPEDEGQFGLAFSPQSLV